MTDLKEKKGEQRLFARFAARFPVRYEHLKNDYSEDIFLRDASAQGVKFTTKRRIFINDSISLSVKLPDGFEPLTLSGKVVWSQMTSPNLWDVGLKFHEIELMKLERMYRSSRQDPFSQD